MSEGRDAARAAMVKYTLFEHDSGRWCFVGFFDTQQEAADASLANRVDGVVDEYEYSAYVVRLGHDGGRTVAIWDYALQVPGWHAPLDDAEIEG